MCSTRYLVAILKTKKMPKLFTEKTSNLPIGGLCTTVKIGLDTRISSWLDSKLTTVGKLESGEGSHYKPIFTLESLPGIAALLFLIAAQRG